MSETRIDKRKIKDIQIIADNGSNHGGEIRLKLFNELTRKPLSSTWYPKLYSDQTFSKVGDTALEYFNLLNKKPFDNFYSLRGYIAEKIIQDMLRSKGYDVETFQLGDDLSRYRPDNSPLYKYFRGLPDIIYKDENGNKILLEIKSKSLGKKEYVVDNPPETEIMQGKMLGVLEGVDEVTMTYVMFDDDIERKMRVAVESVDYYSNEKAYEAFEKLGVELKFRQNFDIHTKKYLIDKKSVVNQMKKAYKYAETFRQTLTLYKKDLSKEIWSELFRFEMELENEQNALKR